MTEGHDYRRTLVAGILRGSTSEQQLEVTKRGELEIIDFYTSKVMEGCGYQVRAGTVATGISAATAIVDTESNMCVDAAVGLTIIPCALRLALLDVAAQTTLACHMKAVGAASTAGGAFVPLPLKQGGVAARSTARVAADGAVTVAAELATTTRRLWEFLALQTQSATVLAVGALGTITAQAYTPILPYIGVGLACVYVQVASNGGTVAHFGALDYIEMLTADI